MNTAHDHPAATSFCDCCGRPWFGEVAYCPYCGLKKGQGLLNAVHATPAALAVLAVEPEGVALAQREPPPHEAAAHEAPLPKPPAWTRPLWEEPAWQALPREEPPAHGPAIHWRTSKAGAVTTLVTGVAAMLLLGLLVLQGVLTGGEGVPVAAASLAPAVDSQRPNLVAALARADTAQRTPGSVGGSPAPAATSAAAAVPVATAAAAAPQRASTAPAQAVTAAPPPHAGSLCSPVSEADGLCKSGQ